MKLKQLILTTALLSGAAMADSTLTYNNADGQEQSKMYLTDGMAKMTSDAEYSTSLIFDAKDNSFTIINHQDKSYMVFGEKEIAALSDVSAMIDKMVEEQLAQMPESQRAQMRGMIKSMMQKQMPKQAAAPTYELSGENKSYNGFDCQEAVKLVNGKKSGSFCVADYQDLGVDTDEYAGLSQFMKTAEKMASQFGQDQSMNFESLGKKLPVYYNMEDQKGYLTDVDNSDLDDSVFQVPAGYKQESLPKEMFN
ncbi:hypothetical protein OS175_05025 [Marinicella sp. S1101]|uniref:hypothetical protein n=1 Tax=Marinicella marina TaxID=2996016 RepID=UPI002260BDFF|nr:hypothetical protein [Marinicella marina]MCX7553230.1 hypothetical protein [Marinicella marina]MDJ1138962.1 hypothetical protein [Marinicella marina]